MIKSEVVHFARPFEVARGRMMPPWRSTPPNLPRQNQPISHPGEITPRETGGDGPFPLSVIHQPRENAHTQSTALITYTAVGGNPDTPCRSRPRLLADEENFRAMSTVSGNVRKRAERAIQREEERAIWTRLRYPTPGDPVGPRTGFGDDAVRLATLGSTHLELEEIAWALLTGRTSMQK